MERKVWGKVFDKETLFALYTLFNRGIFRELGGAVAEGKESRIFIAWNDEPLAVKIYRIDASAFESIWEYIRGDPRFWHVKKNRREVIYAWVRKEFGNLKRLYEAGVNVPRPYSFVKNVLVMQFLGDTVPAPTLKEAKIEKPEELFEKIGKMVKDSWNIAKLVHADLSEYNILVWRGEPYMIDVGQAVDIRHPKAKEFLQRDCRNIARFFSRYIKKSEEELFFKLIKGIEI